MLAKVKVAEAANNLAFPEVFRDRYAGIRLIGAICWLGGAPTLQLDVWLTCRLILSQVWYWTYMGYGWRGKAGSKRQVHPTLQAFIATVTGSVLGTSVLLFFGRIPIGFQSVCWISLMAAITLPLHTLALDPLRIRSFAHGFFATLFGCLLYRVSMPPIAGQNTKE